jgi:superfamily II DNA/RNA helicase
MQTTYTRRSRTRGRRPQNNNNRRPQRFGNSSRQASGRGRRAQKTFDPTQFINQNPVDVKEEVYVPTHTFADFDIDNRLKQTIAQMGLQTPTPIQDQVIPLILNGSDVVGIAETGTGKTAAFLIPLIELKKDDVKAVTLIMTPTRELAIQVDSELKKLTQGTRLYSTVCVGGVGIGGQIRQLRKTNQFIIGTPGRLKDLIERRCIPTNRITSVVLDEADRMLDMGFIHDMRSILSELPAPRHTLFFSATMDERTKGLVHDFMRTPHTVSVKKKDVTNSIKQDVVTFEHAKKYDVLVALLKQDVFRRVIIFGAMKHSVEKLAKELNRSGIKSESIHGNKTHNHRQRSLSQFKSGQVKVLVATDVAARGIHVEDVSHVINYDLPNSFEDYVHRIGRTGRGNKRGLALTFVPSR